MRSQNFWHSFHFSAPAVDDTFWLNITDYLDCSDNDLGKTNWTLDTDFDSDSISVVEMKGNGTFCFANSSLVGETEQEKFSCFVRGHPHLEECFISEGSKSETFWTYFAIRSVFQVSLSHLQLMSHCQQLESRAD